MGGTRARQRRRFPVAYPRSLSARAVYNNTDGLVTGVAPLHVVRPSNNTYRIILAADEFGFARYSTGGRRSRYNGLSARPFTRRFTRRFRSRRSRTLEISVRFGYVQQTRGDYTVATLSVTVSRFSIEKKPPRNPVWPMRLSKLARNTPRYRNHIRFVRGDGGVGEFTRRES